MPSRDSTLLNLKILNAGDNDHTLPWADIYFSPAYGRVEEARGAGTWISIVAADGKWQLPLLKRPLSGDHWDAVSPYGYAGIYADSQLSVPLQQELATKATNWLATEGCVSLFLRESPIVAQGYLPARRVPIISNHPVRVVPISDTDTMWRAMEGRARTAVRKAEKSGLSARVRAAEHHDLQNENRGFRHLYQRTMQRLDAAALYSFNDSYYTALQSELGDSLAVAEVTNSKTETVAAALLMTYGRTQHYHLSGSDSAAARLGANNLLLWAAMKSAAAQGCERFMLGGGLSGEDSLYRFKKSFGGEAQQFRATGYVIDEVAYEEQLRATSGRSAGTPPLQTQPFFPAYRRQ